MGGGIQHGQPVPHVPVSGAPVRSPVAGPSAPIPVSGAGPIPVSGAGPVPGSGPGPVPGSGPGPVPGSGPGPVPGSGPGPVPGSGPGPVPVSGAGPVPVAPANGVPVARPPVVHPPQPPQPQLPPPPAPTGFPPAPTGYPAPPGYPAAPGHPAPPASYPAPPAAPPGPPPSYPAPPVGPPAPPVAAPQMQHRPPTEAPPPAASWSDGSTPTAEEFSRRRQARPVDPVAARGMRGILSKGTLGMVSLGPGRREQEYRHDVDLVRRNFGGLRQVTVVNPKGGAGKTVAVLLLAMTFGQKRGGYVLAWDNNETQGTLGMRAQQDFHTRTVRDLLRDLNHFQGAQGRVGDLSQYVRAQGEGMFDVLASDESATAGEMLTAQSFGEIRDVVSRFYKLIVVDTGNNVRAENWQAAIDATDQLVVTMSARNDSAETASRMLDHLEQHGRQRLVRQAVTVVSMPPSRRHLDVPAITRHFAARTRTVLLTPYERFIDSGEPIRYSALTAASRDAWLKVAAAISEGL
ncbi:chromosome partitioning protein [Dactylosporangium sp. NPDC050688]|uniref:MinD/ParA family ATP-binding protein n=1 Tax=Dactylosporangium sp. NPDC050688 TaxID=3157217 RepID=UPI0033E17CDE